MEAIEAGRRPEKIYLKKDAEGLLFSDLKQLCKRSGAACQEVPVQKLDRLTGGNHQGVVAVMPVIEYSSLSDIVAGIPEGVPALLVALDGVTDIRNFGAIARSAECAGAHGLVVPMKNAAPVNAEAVKSSAGALERIPVCRVGSIRNALRTLAAEGIRAVAADEKAGKLLYGVNFVLPTVIVLGAEDKGISRETLKLCTEAAAIPQRGTIGSLNVGAAAAVVLFEAVRQRLEK